jgi:uncharacterized membrane protein
MKHLATPPEPGATSTVAIARHPLHPMLITFPIALLICAVGSDVAYWYTDDPFWARMSLWLIGTGTTMGILAAITGAVELLWEADIRRLTAGWSHFVVAMVMLSIAAANWMLRLDAPAEFIVPWGVYASTLSAFMVAVAGWMGGKLVFEHKVGVDLDEDEDIA